MAADETGQENASPQDARLVSLNERLDRIKREEAERDRVDQTAESQRVIKTAGMRILTDLLGMPLGGGLVGYFIDGWANSMPWGTLIGMFLGFVIAVRSVVKVARAKPVTDDEGKS